MYEYARTTKRQTNVAISPTVYIYEQKIKERKEISKAKFENDQITRTTHPTPSRLLYVRARTIAPLRAEPPTGKQAPRKPGFSVECAKNAKPWFRNSVR